MPWYFPPSFLVKEPDEQKYRSNKTGKTWVVEVTEVGSRTAYYIEEKSASDRFKFSVGGFSWWQEDGNE